MEELFSTTQNESRAFVWEIDQLGKIHASGVVVGQGGEIRVLRLAGDELRSRVIQKDVVHQTGPPRNSAMRAPEPLVADK